jgi:hypothetical protein
MNPASYFPLYKVRLAVALPIIVCVWNLVRLWWAAELNGVQQIVFVVWFLATLVIEWVSRSAWVWIAGFLAQVALAIVLVLKKQLDDI